MTHTRDWSAIDGFEQADTESLVTLLSRPPNAIESLLRAYLGDALFRRQRHLALACLSERRRAGMIPHEHVVIVPDIFGSELGFRDAQGVTRRVWLDPWAISTGELAGFELPREGHDDRAESPEVVALGGSKRLYGELLLTLARRWDTRVFAYDWRKELKVSAASLEAAIERWFPAGHRVHLVGHGVGALVARTLLKLHPRSAARRGRLVALGAPEEGTVLAAQLLTGTAPLLHQLSALEGRGDATRLANVFATFPALYDLLPSPARGAKVDRFYQASNYPRSVGVSQRLLDASRAHRWQPFELDHEASIAYVSGVGRATPTDASLAALTAIGPEGSPADARAAIKMTDGDGVVALCRTCTASWHRAARYFIDASHDQLPSAAKLLDVVDELLRGEEAALPRDAPRRAIPSEEAAPVDPITSTISNQTRGADTPPERSTEEDADIARRVIQAVLLSRPNDARSAVKLLSRPPRLALGVRCGDITAPALRRGRADRADVIALGIYDGGPLGPVFRELDQRVSRALAGSTTRDARAGDGVLTELVSRRVIGGRLGQLFLFDDPRRGAGTTTHTTLAFVGRGQPGRAGASEVTVLARELCWSLGRLGKHRLATRLIGAGRTGLTIEEAVDAWVDGAKHALTGNLANTLEQITFVEQDPERAREIDRVLKSCCERFDKSRLRLTHVTLAEAPRRRATSVGIDTQEHREPARVNVTLRGDRLRFAALTEAASIPEVEVAVDRRLIERANEELASASDAEQRAERGRFLGQFLVPREFLNEMFRHEPLVLMLDAAAARIHWELVASPSESAPEGKRFLGQLGLSRQLCTTFAPLPSPSPPSPWRMRVVIVADPAADAQLAGALEEGARVAGLFDRFNVLYGHTQNRVEVVRMFGPRDASRTAVLRQLTQQTCDLLHFAGHCRYDEANPDASGWLFSGGEVLSARELRRIERVPRFVFSNACQTGVTPDRAAPGGEGLAPTFAESFFERGVSNFVCTAWPVGDVAAQEFAATLYGALLGVDPQSHARVKRRATRDEPGTARGPARRTRLGTSSPFATMSAAMIAARRAISNGEDGDRSWGAWQHYGNPSFRLFGDRDDADEDDDG